MRYVLSRFKKNQRDETYRIYLAECLQKICENTAKSVGGSYISVSYRDLINGDTEDSRSAEEIIADIIKKAGLEVIST